MNLLLSFDYVLPDEMLPYAMVESPNSTRIPNNNSNYTYNSSNILNSKIIIIYYHLVEV